MQAFADRYMVEHAEVKKRPRSVQGDRALAPSRHARDPGAANRTLTLLSKMFNLAEKWGLRPDGSNPCRHVERYRERKLERFLSSDELAALGEALTEAEQTQTESPSVITAIRLLLYTGCRLSEVLTLRWAHVDLDNGVLRLPESKTGAKLVYLSPPAIEVLQGLPQAESNPFVITGAKPGQHLINLQKPWRRLRCRATVLLWAARPEKPEGRVVSRLREQLERDPTREECLHEAARSGVDLPPALADVRIHDLRHSFASMAVAGGLTLPNWLPSWPGVSASAPSRCAGFSRKRT